MSFSHSRLMFPCEEANVDMRDPVVNTSPISQQLNSDSELQEKSQWPSREEEQGSTGDTWMSPH